MAGKNKGQDEFITGLVIAVVFGFLFLSRGSIWIFPFIFIGIMPALRGLSRMRKRDPQIGEQWQEDKLSLVAKEKKILSVAASEGGKVTPAIVALKTTLSIEEAENILSDLTRRGYASMEINQAGRIEYHFPEFMPPPGEEKPEINPPEN